jgi:hypothetical protein
MHFQQHFSTGNATIPQGTNNRTLAQYFFGVLQTVNRIKNVEDIETFVYHLNPKEKSVDLTL